MVNESWYRFSYWILVFQTLVLVLLLPNQEGTKYTLSIMAITFGIFLWCINLALWVWHIKIESRSTQTLYLSKPNPGFIYVMKRIDGVYKIGRSVDTRKRLKQHIQDYGQEFNLVKRFVVPDSIKMEQLALNMTLRYYHYEEGRYELRKMTLEELNLFLKEFESICKESVCK